MKKRRGKMAATDCLADFTERCGTVRACSVHIRSRKYDCAIGAQNTNPDPKALHSLENSVLKFNPKRRFARKSWPNTSIISLNLNLQELDDVIPRSSFSWIRNELRGFT